MEVDMMILALICFILVLLVLTVIAFLWYLGLFLNIDIKTCKPPFSDLEVAYKFGKGSYSDCGMLFTEAHSIAPELKCIGIYYDDQQQVEGNSLRYIVGLILNDEKAEVKEDLKNDILSKGFQITKFPEVEHVVYSTFPHHSTLSIIIAANRVIPSFRSYIKEHKLQAYPLIEIYSDRKIIYIAPLSKQDEFFVPEALAESEEEVTSDQRNDEEDSLRELEEIPDTLSSADSLVEITSKIEELPASEQQILESLDDEHKGVSNGSEASTESFEELQLDS